MICASSAVLEDEIKAPDSFKTAAASQSDVGRGGGTGRMVKLLLNILSVNPETVSKVVDENGEPMVVPHRFYVHEAACDDHSSINR